MRLVIRILFWFAIFIFSNNSFAEINSAAEQLIQQLDAIHNLQANFIQVIYDNNGRVLQQTNGQMTLQRPGKFRWETKNPSKQLLIADGSQVWFYDVDLAQVSVQKQHSLAENSPAMLLSGTAAKLAKDYIIRSLKTNEPESIAFKLTPKIQSNFFQAVELYFSQNRLHKMHLIDNLNQITEVNFSDVQNNIELNPALFHFHLPKNVDVVKQ